MDLRAGLEAVDKELMRYGAQDNWPRAPWALTVNDHEWAVATDGVILVAVHRELVAGDCAVIPKAAGKLAREWIPKAAAEFTVIEATQLKTFAGLTQTVKVCETCDNRRKVECDECDGEGGYECECSRCGDIHDHECKRCEGTGERRCPDCQPSDDDDRTARLSGAIVSRDVLARALTAVCADNDSPIAIAVERHGTTGRMFVLRPAVTAPTWMALIMSMRDDLKPKVSFEQPETWQRSADSAVSL